MIDLGRRVPVDTGMAERYPVKALAEQPSGMRRCAVIVPRQLPPRLVPGSDMAEIAALRRVECERPELERGLVLCRVDRRLAAATIGEAVGPDPAAGEIIGPEFPPRQP